MASLERPFILQPFKFATDFFIDFRRGLVRMERVLERFARIINAFSPQISSDSFCPYEPIFPSYLKSKSKEANPPNYLVIAPRIPNRTLKQPLNTSYVGFWNFVII